MDGLVVSARLGDGGVKGSVVRLLLRIPADRQHRNVAVAKDVLAEIVEAVSYLEYLARRFDSRRERDP